MRIYQYAPIIGAIRNWQRFLALIFKQLAAKISTCTGFNYESENVDAPDLCWVRKPNIKMGIGINMEQAITEDIGVFFRCMVSDGKTEVYSYTSSDQSLSFGAAMKGLRWGREKDSLGVCPTSPAQI